MRPLNLDNVQASSEDDYKTLKPGAYACRITEAEDFEEKEYVRLLFDIIVGEFEGFFSDSFYDDKPFAHAMALSYKDAALPMLKGRLETISECNTGFDAVAAFNGGRPEMLVGKVVGVVFREEEYFKKDEDRFAIGSPRPQRLCTLKAIEEGKIKKLEPVMLNDRKKREALQRGGVYDPDRWLSTHTVEDGGTGAATATAQAAPADAYSDDLPF